MAANPTCAEGGICRVGDVGPGGGTVFYVATTAFATPGAPCNTNCSALEAAPLTGNNAWDVSGTYRWNGVYSTAIGTTGSAIGSGYSNTVKMVTQPSSTAGTAGTVSRAYRGPQNLTDWFLPSKYELRELYLASYSKAGLPELSFSSSTELSATAIYSIAVTGEYAGDDEYSGFKTNPYRVIPIRAFFFVQSSAPDAPTLNSVSTGDKRLTVAFSAGANNGADITDYEYSLNGGSYTSAGATASPFTITGLSGRTTYSITIKARNSAGLSVASNSLSALTTDSSLDASEAAAEAARVATAAEAARVATAAAAQKAKEQKELTELLSVVPSIAGLALNLGDLTNSLLKQKCTQGKKVKYVNKGAKCPKGFKSK